MCACVRVWVWWCTMNAHDDFLHVHLIYKHRPSSGSVHSATRAAVVEEERSPSPPPAAAAAAAAAAPGRSASARSEDR